MSGLLDAPGATDYIGNMASVTAATQLSVPLPADLRQWVEARVAAEGYSDAADYVRQLVQRDQDEYEEDVRRVRLMVQEGLDSGIVDAEPEDILDEIIAEIRNGHG